LQQFKAGAQQNKKLETASKPQSVLKDKIIDQENQVSTLESFIKK